MVLFISRIILFRYPSGPTFIEEHFLGLKNDFINTAKMNQCLKVLLIPFFTSNRTKKKMVWY